MRYDESEVEFEDEVDLLMTSDIVSAQVSTKPITFSKVQSGWFFKEDRQELVGTYNANFYSINGMVLETRKRREHLSNDDLQKNKALLENFAKGKQKISSIWRGSAYFANWRIFILIEISVNLTWMFQIDGFLRIEISSIWIWFVNVSN